jgi:hypothetical protein
LEDELTRLHGQTFRDAARLIESADAVLLEQGLPPLTAPQIEAMLEASITPDAAKAHLITPARENLQAEDLRPIALAVGGSSLAIPFGPGVLRAGDLSNWMEELPAGLSGLRWGKLVLDPKRGRVALSDGAPSPDRALYCQRIHIGIFHPVGAGTYERRDGLSHGDTSVIPVPRGPLGPSGEDLSPGPVGGFSLPTSGVHEFLDSKTYEPLPPAADTLHLAGDLVLQAADGTRPYLRLIPADGASSLIITSPAPQTTLVIDGLWLGIEPSGNSASADPQPVETRLVLDGVFAQVVLRRVTLDPGGLRARVDAAEGMAIPFVQLEVAGAVERLLIDRCVVGPIHEIAGGVDPCSAARISLCDSVVVSADGRPALRAPVAALEMERCTVFGDVEGARLEASDCLFDGALRVEDRQGSCVRFSAFAGSAGIRSYESHSYAEGLPPWLFVSRTFGDPGFAQLAEIAPGEILTGAENRSEMGVFNRALAPIRRADLAAKWDEYTAINAITQLVIET